MKTPGAPDFEKYDESIHGSWEQTIGGSIQHYLFPNGLDDPTAFDRLNGIRDYLHELSPNDTMPADHVRWVPIERVTPNDYNPNHVARQEMVLLLRSIMADGYCVEASTLVLKADLTWVQAGSLVANDRVVSFDEDATVGSGARKQRRYQTATVLANFVEDDELVEVETDRGEVIVTPDHPFLVKRLYGKGHYGATWVAAADMVPGDVAVYLMRPWQTDETWAGGWLAGFLDGEGTIAQNQRSGHAPHVRLSGYQRPGATADRMVREMSTRAMTKVFTVKRPESPKWNDMVMARVDRLTEIMRLLGIVRPGRLLESGGEFWVGSALASTVKDASMAVIRSVTPAGRGRIARLSTSTGTFIANGFAVHNTQPVVTVWNGQRKLECLKCEGEGVMAEGDKCEACAGAGQFDGCFEIVDGFHRYFTMRSNAELYAKCHGRLPIVIIDKSMNDRMASTVRHNRARGKHSVNGMANMVFDMLDRGMTDADVCNELGMEAEELVRIKHITGFSKLFADTQYNRAWVTRSQTRIKLAREARNQAEAAQRAVVDVAAPVILGGEARCEDCGGVYPNHAPTAEGLEPCAGEFVAPIAETALVAEDLTDD